MKKKMIFVSGGKKGKEEKEREKKMKKKKKWKSQVANQKVRSVCLGVVRLGLGLCLCL